MTTDPTLHTLPANIHAIRETPDGWEGAPHRDGPWLPIPAPQTQPPFPVGEGRWSEGVCGDGAAILFDGVMIPIKEVVQALNRIPAALAEPLGEGPTDDELLAMRSWSSHGPTFDSDLVDFARAALARYGRPAAPKVVGISGPGEGDDVACEKCGAVALDTGLECDNCGHDNYEAVNGRPFAPASQVDELIEWLTHMAQAGLGGRDELNADRAATLLQQLSAPTPAGTPPIVRYEFEITDELDQTVACGDAATLEDAEREGHYLAQYQQDGPCTLELRRVELRRVELRRVELLSVSAPEPVSAAAETPLWRVLPVLPQSQASLADQMAELIQVAIRLGLYDAADCVRRDQEWRGLAAKAEAGE
jgi:hypothetical protein